MITVTLELGGAEADLRRFAQDLSKHFYVPYWESYAVGRGQITAKVGEWDCNEGDTILSAVDSFADHCLAQDLSCRADGISADLKIVLLVDNETQARELVFWPGTLSKLAQLGLGLVIAADIGVGYPEDEITGPDDIDDDEDDRSADIEHFISTMTSISRSAIGRTGSHTFTLIKKATPTTPFSMLHRREISSRLAQLYAPPFYCSLGAAKAAASQHARATWALSAGLGDMTASNIAQYLASL